MTEKNETFDLEAFRTRRDAAIAAGLRWQATEVELLAAYAAEERAFAYIELPKGVNLRGANLRGANLYEADLEGAALEGANLSGAILEGAALEGANLSGAILYEAYLRGANLRGAYLYGANLRGAYLYGANLYGANLRGANLRGAYLYGANLEGADLSGANLYGANLYGAKFIGAITPIGSRADVLFWYFCNGELKLKTGCFNGNLQAFKARVADKPAGDANRLDYEALFPLLERIEQRWQTAGLIEGEQS